ncbi:MAG: hypothetical protein IJ841_04705 [Prevotella sp.]|nr:hypothetical protein [Prevotella sp.]
MEDLKFLLSKLNARSSEDEIEATFKSVAEKLLKEFHIVKNGRIFRLIEIEFYFCNAQHKDTITYKRTENAGRWFMHRGVDITFNSNEKEGFYGGILIRSVIPLDSAEAILGPEKCLWELFDDEALLPNTIYPFIEKKANGIYSGEILSRERYHVKGEYKESPYRFYVNGISIVGLKNYSANPWK